MMKYNIRGDKLVITDAIRSYIETKLSKLGKYFNDDSVTANVLVKTKGKEEIIEITIPTTKYTLRAEERHDDLYAAIDLAEDKLERQIRKNKTRLMNQVKVTKNNDFYYDIEIDDEDYDDEEETSGKVINKRKKLDSKPFSEEQAIIQMELLDHDFFVFKDAETNTISVLYKKKDGNYGIIKTN